MITVLGTNKMGRNSRSCLDRKTNPFLSLLRCLLAWPERVVLRWAVFSELPRILSRSH